MQVPVESRVLLGVASFLAPREVRAEWRREWDAEIWWWLGSHAGERLQLAAHCSGALWDALYLRADGGNLVAAASRVARKPSACLGGLGLMLAAVAIWSGLGETRRLLRDQPFAGAHLALLSQTLPFMGAHYGVPTAKLADWEARAQSLEGAAPYLWNREGGGAVRAGPKFFSLLGTRAALGTLSAPAGGAPAAILSYSYWQGRFRGDAAILGRTISAGGASAQVIGVLPRDFWFPDARPDIWLLSLPPAGALTRAVARLKPGVTPAVAQSELRILAAQVRPASSGSAVTVESLENLSERPLTTLGVPWLVLVAGAAAMALLRYRHAPRFGAFLAAKAVLSLTLVLLLTVEFGSSWMIIHGGDSNLGAGVASLWLFLAAPAAALYWCWRDQRQRCRNCLNRLTLPVHISSGARTLLDRRGTELVCSRGHGTLFTDDGDGREQQWHPLDSSWRELFAGK